MARSSRRGGTAANHKMSIPKTRSALPGLKLGSTMVDLLRYLGGPKSDASGLPSDAEVPGRVLVQIYDAIEAAAKMQGCSCGLDLAISRGQRAGYCELRSALNTPATITFPRVASLIYFMGLSLDELGRGPPAPWERWQRGQTLLVWPGVSLGRRGSTGEKRTRVYEMIQKHDLEAAIRLHRFVGQLRIHGDVEVQPRACNGIRRAKSEIWSELNSQRTDGIIVIGSENANSYAAAAHKLIHSTPTSIAPNYRLDVKPEKGRKKRTPPQALYLQDEKVISRTGKKDAGLVCIRRFEIEKIDSGRRSFREVLLIWIAGLGPAGTLAAAEAFMQAHELEERFDAEQNFLEAAVLVRDTDAVLDQVSATPCGWQWHTD